MWKFVIKKNMSLHEKKLFYLIGEYLFSPQAYLREGVALQNLGQHGEALAAFGAGLAQDANNTNLIMGLIDAALKSPLKGIDTTF